MLFDADCRRCPLSERPRAAGLAVCVPSSGPIDADILFMGEAPGGDEEQENAPFVGAAGRELDALLARAKLRRSRVRISNVVRCRPENNAKPTAEEVAACSYYTVREIAKVRPKVIVALGGSALKALTDHEKVGENRGKMLPLLPMYRSSVRVVPTYHPAAYLHQPSNRAAFSKAIVEDMRLARKAASGRGVDALVVTPSDGDAAVADALARLANAERLACDLEWEVIPARGKLEPKGMWPWSRRRGVTPRPISIALAGRVNGQLLAIAVPFDSPHIGIVKALVRKIPTFYHHATADLIWLYSMGWKPKLCGDTLVLASLLNLDTSLSLAALASMLTKMPPDWKGETAATIGRMPTTEAEWRALLLRNANDGIATVLLLERLERMVVKRGREKVLQLYKRVLLPAVEILARASLDGAPIDAGMLSRIARRTDARLDILRREIGDALGLDGNYERIIASGDKLGPYIERALGVTLPRTRKTHKTQVTNDGLSQLKGAYPVVPKLLRERRLAKAQNAYTRPWGALLALQGDERLHTVYRLTEARTGRSSAEGELGNTWQQFPRRGAFRRIVKARDGWLILSVDQGTIEMRIAAWLAQEQTMLGFFRDGVDVHTALAGLIKASNAGWTIDRYRKDMARWMDGVTERERYGAKAGGFGLLFFGSAQVLKKTARINYGITLADAEAETIVDAFFSLYPSLPPWHQSCWEYVKQGWVETPTGRRRPLVFDESEDYEARLRKAINTPVQNFASDLSLFCMAYTWELLRTEYGKHVRDVAQQIGFFHDAGEMHILASERGAIEEIVRTAWEHPPLERLGIDLTVPLVADIKIGRRWES